MPAVATHATEARAPASSSPLLHAAEDLGPAGARNYGRDVATVNDDERCIARIHPYSREDCSCFACSCWRRRRATAAKVATEPELEAGPERPSTEWERKERDRREAIHTEYQSHKVLVADLIAALPVGHRSRSFALSLDEWTTLGRNLTAKQEEAARRILSRLS